MTSTENTLRVSTTSIDGLLVVDLPIHGDNRGWFKEHWQREKMVELGLPDFGPVQQNISFNSDTGTTRGIHAEPWDKYVSVANGRAFGAWVDLREGNSFGQTFTIELSPAKAVFVPRGVANAFQTLEPNTTYMYLVNDHWSPSAKYTFVNLADPKLAIQWPIPLSEATVSEKDRNHPLLPQVRPIAPKKTVVLGANGQLGRALRNLLPSETALFLGRSEFDLTDPISKSSVDWGEVSAIINAAAFTAVDEAESPNGRTLAWKINATANAELAAVAATHRIPLVTVSSDYVFDGTRELHLESEHFSPLGVYGQTKAAGELAVAAAPVHYTIRTSWVIGDGKNFVRTMAELCERGLNPSVIDDQFGRPTFATDLAAAIIHLLQKRPPSGTYNFSNSGAITTWHEIARSVFSAMSADPARVSAVTSAAYQSQQESQGKRLAPRPTHSTFDLSKIEATGFQVPDWKDQLNAYLTREDLTPMSPPG